MENKFRCVAWKSPSTVRLRPYLCSECEEALSKGTCDCGRSFQGRRSGDLRFAENPWHPQSNNNQFCETSFRGSTEQACYPDKSDHTRRSHCLPNLRLSYRRASPRRKKICCQVLPPSFAAQSSRASLCAYTRHA